MCQMGTGTRTLEHSSSAEPDASQVRFWCLGNLPEASDCDAPVAAAMRGAPYQVSLTYGPGNALIAKVSQCGLRANRRPLGDWRPCLTDGRTPPHRLRPLRRQNGGHTIILKVLSMRVSGTWVYLSRKRARRASSCKSPEWGPSS